MFKLHKPQLSGSIHSGHFMVSRLDDDDDDNNDPADDSSESERDNANSVEIDVNNPDSVVDANNLDLNYRVESTSGKNEQLTSWNDLDRPAKSLQKQHQYLTYYTNSYCDDNNHSDGGASSSSQAVETGNKPAASLHHVGGAERVAAAAGSSAAGCIHENTNIELLHSRGQNSHLDHLHQHHHLQDHQQMANQLQNQHHNQPHQQFHHQHAVTIDTSLTKLLECMSLYYSSKLTSPKWKSFKGLKLRLKYKIRLNNLIWRAWFLQYIRGRRPPGCQFTAPVETDVHKKSETIVLEGKYWKRKEKAIVDEYNKWRTFHKQKSQMICFRPSSFDWDSRVSNLASSSSLYGPAEYAFYPDYDMNSAYNLDDLPPMLEDIDGREADSYCSHQSQSRASEHQLALQQQQQQQQSQLAHLQVGISSGSQVQQALSLKRETVPIGSGGQQVGANFSQAPHQQQLQQQALQLNRPAPVPFNFNGSPLYQQINEQLQHRPPPPPPPPPMQQQHQQEQQLQQHQHRNVVIPMSQELYPFGSGGSSSSSQGRTEQRRVCHINAEQKRRCNIKNGFDTLKSILPSINQNVNVKISKASMLQKAAMYISTLSAEQKQQADEQAMLRQQIESLKQTISAYQAQLPASGGPVGCQRTSKARELLQEYARRRTLENWKFWIFSLLIEPLFETYYSSVSTNSLEDACKTICTWLDQSCGLVSLRKDVLESLTFLSTSTNILNTPQTLATEAVQAARYPQAHSSQAPLGASRQQQQQQSAPLQSQLQHHQQPQQQVQLQHHQQATTSTPMQTQPMRPLW